MTGLCPDCGQPLSREVFMGVQIDTCTACAGIWFDNGELRRLMQAHPHALLALEEHIVPTAERNRVAPSRRLCPVCHIPLFRFLYHYDSPVELDTCESCSGVWVEDGELRAIQDWLDRGQAAEAERAPQPEKLIIPPVSLP
jgi:Zn-finger nucleic acid-binding protein